LIGGVVLARRALQVAVAVAQGLGWVETKGVEISYSPDILIVLKLFDQLAPFASYFLLLLHLYVHFNNSQLPLELEVS
jgi:hypothetical protein